MSSKCSKALPSVVAVSGEGADLKRSNKEGDQQSNGHHSEALLLKANGTPIDSRVFVSTGFSSHEMFRCEKMKDYNI